MDVAKVRVSLASGRHKRVQISERCIEPVPVSVRLCNKCRWLAVSVIINKICVHLPCVLSFNNHAGL